MLLDTPLIRPRTHVRLTHVRLTHGRLRHMGRPESRLGRVVVRTDVQSLAGLLLLLLRLDVRGPRSGPTSYPTCHWL